ncbi:MAG: BMP family ABC transporter substrate-binding protein [Firmicutes bacterium]|nr:BMP family ABC transporter substrate-binding protein [[Eubacterium] siraeum]MCM1488961.1 BMP family ABC transporter substrate-binding protein [Bacillota bacterium]
MKTKKILAILLAGCLLFTGCNNETDDPEATDEEPKYVTVTDEEGNAVTDENGEVVTSIEGAKPEEKELKVGFIYPESAGGDALSDVFEAARLEAMRVLGAKTYYVENVLVSQVEAATAALVQEGCNVIVGASAKFANAIHDEATANSKVYFISFGGTDGASNLACYQGEMYKGSYLSGITAAFNTDSNILGVVADPAVLNVYNVIDGFVMGAREISEKDTDVRVNWAWGQNDGDIMNAINNLRDQGCDVIFSATYSNFAVKYCESLGIKVIGMASDTPELAPENYLTGCYYNLSLFLVDMLRTVRYDTYGSVNYQGGINEGTIRMVELGGSCYEGTDEIFDAAYELCSDGKISVFKNETKDTEHSIKIEKGVTLSSDQIIAIDWLEESVKAENNYCTANLNPVESDLMVYPGQVESSEDEDEEEAAETVGAEETAAE